jgi:hypothetical protein
LNYAVGSVEFLAAKSQDFDVQSNAACPTDDAQPFGPFRGVCAFYGC